MTGNEKLDLILNGMSSLKNDMGSLKGDVGVLKDDTKEIKQRTTNIENDVTDIGLTIENEIRVNIQRIAEGHLDLSRNLREALKIQDQKEMLALRVNILENETRRIKEQQSKYIHDLKDALA